MKRHRGFAGDRKGADDFFAEIANRFSLDGDEALFG